MWLKPGLYSMAKRVAIMAYKRKLTILVFLILFIVWVQEPIGRNTAAIDVDDGTLVDWVGARATFNDTVGNPGVALTNLMFVAFDFDDTWLYVRWDMENNSVNSEVLFDMGINLTATGEVWDIFLSAQIESVMGVSTLTNISIRDPTDNHIWNASDDGNMTEDGSLYFDPVPGGTPGNHSTEARFPLSLIGAPAGVIFGQFRSHASLSVSSAVKDWVPEPPAYIVLSIDDDPPQLSNLTDAPDPQDSGGNVNITVDVTDDFSVDEVMINITHPNGSWTNTSMNPGSLDQWFSNITYDFPGIYSYTIWANDSSGNWNSTGPGTFMILDIDPPELDNLTATPDLQENGGEINITVDVIDPDGVGEVWVNITFPDGGSINVSMDPSGGSEWFQNTTYGDVGLYTFKVYANDTFGNWNSTGPETFTIVDTDAPEFLDAADSPDPQENGGNVNITAQVIDDEGVDEVWAAVIYPDTSVANNSMAAGIGNEWFFDAQYNMLGVYSYTVWARDVHGNWNATNPGTFTIIDTDPPEFYNLLAIPDPQENGGDVTVSADVSDDVSVEEVWINITNPDGNWSNSSMNMGSGDQYSFSSTFSILGDYNYEIWAVDSSNNWNSTSPGAFVIRDTDSPDIGDPDATPEEQEEGGDVNITVDVTDDVGTEEVWVEITLPDGTSLNVSMTKGEDDEWYFEDAFDDPGDYSYTIWAADESGNWNSRGPEVFSITPEPPEEPPEEPEDEPDFLHMIILLFFWPLFLILITALIVRMYAFDNRFKRHLDKKAPEFDRNFEAMHPYSSGLNRQAMQEIVVLCLKAGIPVEEFILALQGAWSNGQVDAAQPGFLNDDMMAIFNSIMAEFDRFKTQ